MISRRRFVQSCLAAAIVGVPIEFARANGQRRIVIVGAGAAGIAAARLLKDAGVEIAIVEARERIGGRAWTDTESIGVAWDRGGSWLHSSDINPLVSIARKLGIAVTADEAPFALFRDGKRVEAAVIEALKALLGRAYDELAEAGERRLDIAAYDALSAETRTDPLFPLVAGEIEGFEGVELEHYSVLDSHHYIEEGPDFVIPSGYGALINRLGQDLPVELGVTVRRIDWSGAGVRLDTNRGRIESDAVIVTVPTSVLARNQIVFTPALPIALEQAAHDLPLGLLDKVAMLLEPGALPTARNESVFLADAAPDVFGLHTRLWGSNAVLGYVSGAYAHALELEGERAMIAAAVDQLAAIFGNDIRAAVRTAVATRWAHEPWTYGSYSHCVPGRFGARARLTEPVGERVFFAGEHTEQSAYGTVHGAWMSGERAAQGVLHALRAARRLEA